MAGGHEELVSPYAYLGEGEEEGEAIGSGDDEVSGLTATRQPSIVERISKSIPYHTSYIHRYKPGFSLSLCC